MGTIETQCRFSLVFGEPAFDHYVIDRVREKVDLCGLTGLLVGYAHPRICRICSYYLFVEIPIGWVYSAVSVSDPLQESLLLAVRESRGFPPLNHHTTISLTCGFVRRRPTKRCYDPRGRRGLASGAWRWPFPAVAACGSPAAVVSRQHAISWVMSELSLTVPRKRRTALRRATGEDALIIGALHQSVVANPHRTGHQAHPTGAARQADIAEQHT